MSEHAHYRNRPMRSANTSISQNTRNRCTRSRFPGSTSVCARMNSSRTCASLPLNVDTDSAASTSGSVRSTVPPPKRSLSSSKSDTCQFSDSKARRARFPMTHSSRLQAKSTRRMGRRRRVPTRKGMRAKMRMRALMLRRSRAVNLIVRLLSHVHVRIPSVRRFADIVVGLWVVHIML